ncbi:hypothetical protein B14911_24345 [Bacillus sp. NRRL B-14911]|nr:hypothetical protein B14911_24345 [Bacillus sp. NRRL B-14911]
MNLGGILPLIFQPVTGSLIQVREVALFWLGGDCPFIDFDYRAGQFNANIKKLNSRKSRIEL